MRSTARTALLYALPAWLVAWAWLRLEEPRGATGRAALLLLFALAPAIAPAGWRRAPVLAASVLAAILVAFAEAGGRSAGGALDSAGGLPLGIKDGFLGFYDVTLPFDGRVHPLMEGVLLLGVFAFGLALAFLIAARRPLGASLALLGGVAWPATLRSVDDSLRLGALLLGAVLLLLAFLRERRSAPRSTPRAAVVGAVALAGAVAASTSPAVARDAFLDWKSWDLYTQAGNAVSVQYVWNSNYSGIRFPPAETTVLRIKAPPTPLYWRVTTLDSFTGYGWVENVAFTTARRSGSRDIVGTVDPLLPRRALRAPLVEQTVRVENLLERRLAGASVPVAFEPGSVGPVMYAEGGIAFAPRDLSRGDTYKVWSYTAAPTPRQLAPSPARYPGELVPGTQAFSVTETTGVPPFGTPRRRQAMRALLRRNYFDDRIAPYAALYERAEQVAGGARTPYGAVVALESWFRSTGGFRYEELPPQVRGTPALAAFVLRTKRGYCQHFAGAMALMLRYLGIPARVAAGFTSGRYDSEDGEWIVTDHNAHTWVEVWFAGYGWLPFDPTPARGTLSGSYSSASASFEPSDAMLALGAAGRAAQTLEKLRGEDDRGLPPLEGLVTGAATSRDESGGDAPAWRPAAWLVAAVALASMLLAAAKHGRRRLRYGSSNPRRVAAACRLELLDVLRDQRIAVPPSATLHEIGALLASRYGVAADGLIHAAEEARFAPPERAGAAARRIERRLRALKRELRRRLTAVARVRGFLSLRSLVARQAAV